MVLKPHVQRHTNITLVLFATPSGGVKSNRGKFGDFQPRRISETVRGRVIVTINLIH